MAKGPTRSMRKRLVCIMLAILICGFVPVTAKLAYIQIVQYKKYQEIAIEQQTRNITISAKRGTIFDTNGKTLAVSASAYKVIINPKAIKNEDIKADIVKNLAVILNITEEKVKTACEKTNTYYVELVRRIEKEVADQVREFIKTNKKYSSIISVYEDPKRYYPFNSLASNLIGFTGIDNQGLSGIEALYDNYLIGTNGRVIRATDVNGNETPFSYEKQIDAKDGYNLTLTIDEGIQHFLEKHLEQAANDYRVTNRACAIAMNVKTGEILAMAVKGDYNLNSPFALDESDLAKLEGLEGDEYSAKRTQLLNEMWRNKCVTEAYEPGSTFKVFTAAMALEENIVKLDDHFNCHGYLNVGGWKISCAKRAPGHGNQTFVEGFVNSCNPVFMEVGARVGPAIFLKYVSGFGFAQKTNVNIPGEATGIFHSAKNFNEVELATSSFGQTFKVTPIQLITAFSAVVNGGYLYQPTVVKEIKNQNGGIVEKFEPKLVRQVISTQTSKTMVNMLGEVLKNNKYVNTVLEGYRIGGKTGTSEKRDLTDAQGRATERIASFVGVAPLDDPQIAILVMFDQPQTETKFGSVLATPVAVRMFADILPYMGIEPTEKIDSGLGKNEVIMPNVLGLTKTEAEKKLSECGLNPVFNGAADIVTYQVPSFGQKLTKTSKVLVYLGENSELEKVKVPNVLGMTYAQAKKALTDAGLNINAVGKDLNNEKVAAILQSISEGQMVNKGTVITVDFLEITQDGGHIIEEN